jgi:uncharacterized protein (UPF0276 family)
LAGKHVLPHWEVITENLFSPTKVDIETVEKLRSQGPIFLHGVALSIGSSEELDMAYLQKAKKVYDQWEPELISDHLCWCRVGGQYFHDLYPIAYNPESLRHISDRIQKVQDYFQRPLCLENVSSYVKFKDSEMQEWDFLAELVAKTGSQLLLDVNNILVNSVNFGFEPTTYIESIPAKSVAQIHIAGAKAVDDFLLDDHGSAPSGNSLALLQQALIRFGEATPVLLEWDNEIPSFSELLIEGERVRQAVS